MVDLNSVILELLLFEKDLMEFSFHGENKLKYFSRAF
jgi:hypothetical protein